MTFGAISIADPEWLQELSRPGREAECQAYKRYGDTALRDGKYGLAAAQYLKALRIKPDAVSVHVNLGVTYIRAGNPAKGVELLSQALEMDPCPSLRAAIYHNLGGLYEKEGKRTEAIGCFQKVIESGVNLEGAYHKLAAQYFATGHYEQARDALEQKLAAQLDPTQPYRQMLLRSIDQYSENEVHLPIIEKLAAQEVAPDDLARYDLELFRQVRRTDPAVSETYTLLGRVCAQLDDFDQARRHFQKSLEVWPENPEARNDLAKLERLRQGQP